MIWPYKRNPPSLAKLKEELERPTSASLWGQPTRFRPRVLAKAFGDGRQLILIASVNQRPRYWIVRVDSGWQIDGDADEFRDQLDGIKEAIEDEFGMVPIDDEGEPERDGDWPEADFSVGCEWGSHGWPGVTWKKELAMPREAR